MSQPDVEEGQKPKARSRAPRAAKPVAEAVAAPPAPKPAGVVLPASMTIREVDDLRAPLMRAILGGSLEVDGSALQTIDTAGVQLLIAAFRSAAARGIAPRWVQSSDVLMAASNRLGVSPLLGLGGPA